MKSVQPKPSEPPEKVESVLNNNHIIKENLGNVY